MQPPPIVLQVAEWAPDLPTYNPKFSTNVNNVIPRTPLSYGPISMPQVFSGALGGKCQGASFCIDNPGNVYGFAGTATDLYELTSGSTNWGNVSQSSGGYNLPADEFWYFTLFGTRIIAQDYADAMQSFILGTSTKFVDLANGGITGLTLTGGTGYTPGTYALAVSGAGSGVSFAGTVTVSAGGVLTSYTITNQGKLYPQTATINIPAGATLGSGAITALTLVGGTGYTPGTYALTVGSPGAGTGFAGTVTVNAGGALASYVISDEGSLYSPSATIAVPSGAGGGSGGTITPTINAIATGGAITPTIATIAPNARYGAIVKGFFMAANTNDPVNGPASQRVWWAADNDPTDWPTPGTLAAATLQSSYNDLVGPGGWNMGVVGNLGNADGAIFQQHAVWRVMYAGPPNTFDFLPAEGIRGTPAPGSIVQLGAIAYYLGEDGFYAFDGANSVPIGNNKVDKYFWANVDQQYLTSIVGSVDPINKVIAWFFAGVGNSGGLSNQVIMYNWAIDRWSIASISCEFLVRALTFGYTLDQLYTVLGYTLDDLPFPLDSSVWTGGSLVFGLFDTNHKLNFFSGTALAATVDTAEVEPFPGQRTMWTDARPLVDGGNPSVAIFKRERLVDTSISFPVSPINSLGTCPSKGSGRYIKAEITMPAGAAWTNLQGVELIAAPDGVR